MLGRMWFVFFVLMALPTYTCWATSVVAPEPMGYSWSISGYNSSKYKTQPYAEIFPPHTRNNSGNYPLCYFYAVPQPGRDYGIGGRLVWKRAMVSPELPYRIIMPNSGSSMIAVSTYVPKMSENASLMAIYGKQGNLLKSYSLRNMYSPEAISSMPTAPGPSIAWSTSKAFFISADDRCLEIRSSISKQASRDSTKDMWLRFDLSTGKMKRVPPVLDKSRHWYEYMDHTFPLRFSSLTDVLKSGKSSSKAQTAD